MKRIALAARIGLVALVPAFSQGMDLGTFPLGRWLDANYDAVWEFTSGNIRIVAPDGTVYFDFGKVEVRDFKVGAGTDGPFITFSCDATGKSYKLSKPLSKSSVILEIQRPSLPLYRVEMPKQ